MTVRDGRQPDNGVNNPWQRRNVSLVRNGHRGEQFWIALPESRPFLPADEADELCPGNVRFTPQLPGKPLEPRLDMVGLFVVIVRQLVVIPKTFIMFHAQA